MRGHHRPLVGVAVGRPDRRRNRRYVPNEGRRHARTDPFRASVAGDSSILVWLDLFATPEVPMSRTQTVRDLSLFGCVCC